MRPVARLKRVLREVLPALDWLLAILVVPAALLLWAVRRAGIQRLPACRRVLCGIGVFPIRDHYYEPLFRLERSIPQPADGRSLPGLDLNVAEQLRLLDRFEYASELVDPLAPAFAELTFRFENPSFEAGDADYLYNLIRVMKPARIIEIGSGFSTLMAVRAVEVNKRETPGYSCHHICIEPYEFPWLESTGVTVIRERAERVPRPIWRELQRNDLLFIDSSHVIRPGGDVLFEYLEVLPGLAPGVIVHIHDIFTPRDYPDRWLVDEVRFWNEQYLLEAFLIDNPHWRIIGALNYLHHHHYERLREKCPFLTPEREPGSFYIQRR